MFIKAEFILPPMNKFNMPYHPYRIYGDIKGTVPLGGTIGKDDVYVGTILFNERFRPHFLAEFYRKFPHIEKFENKGSNLSDEKLLDVINFMNEKRINMACAKFHYHAFKRVKNTAESIFIGLTKRKPSFPFERERILALPYYYAMRELGLYQNCTYEGQICIESQVSIDKVMSRISSLANRDSYRIFLSPNYRRQQHLLKFADFVASAGQLLDKGLLTPLPYFKMIYPHETDEDVKHIFSLHKLKADIEARQNIWKIKQ